jgi:hypothetical protein
MIKRGERRRGYLRPSPDEKVYNVDESIHSGGVKRDPAVVGNSGVDLCPMGQQCMYQLDTAASTRTV